MRALRVSEASEVTPMLLGKILRSGDAHYHQRLHAGLLFAKGWPARRRRSAIDQLESWTRTWGDADYVLHLRRSL